MAVMYDSISAASIPADAEVVAGYVDGWWPDFAAIQLRFPHLPQVSITTAGKDKAGDWVLAIVCDCENGDASPATAAGWAKWMISYGRRPTIYCNTSTHGDVVAELAKLDLQFVRDVDWWEAHYDNDPTLSPGSVSKQYQSTDGWDISSTDGIWPAVAPAPGPIPIPKKPTEAPPMALSQPVEWWKMINVAQVGHGGPPDPNGVPTGGCWLKRTHEDGTQENFDLTAEAFGAGKSQDYTCSQPQVVVPSIGPDKGSLVVYVELPIGNGQSGRVRKFVQAVGQPWTVTDLP